MDQCRNQCRDQCRDHCKDDCSDHGSDHAACGRRAGRTARRPLALTGTALLLALASAGAVAKSAGEAADTEPRWGALFDSTTPLAVTLHAPVGALAGDRAAEPEYRPGKLAWSEADGRRVVLDIGIRPRGKNRRDPKTCKTPPLRLNLRTREAAGTLFAGQDKLKLVTHCANLSSRRTSTLDRVYIEELAYRIWGLLADGAFRTRLLDLTWVDTGRDREVLQPAFLIEHRKQLADRLGLDDPKPTAVGRSALDAQATSRAALFQYMIGNTDYSFIRGPEGDACCHNLVLLANPDGTWLPVPYDFDSTGLVNPPYAQPAAQLPIRRVTQRYFRGWCEAPAAAAATRAHFLDHRAAITALFADHPKLSDDGKRKALRYLGRFWDELADADDWERRYRRQCR